MKKALETEHLGLAVGVEVVQVGGVEQVQPRQPLTRLRQVRLGLQCGRRHFSGNCYFESAFLCRTNQRLVS